MEDKDVKILASSVSGGPRLSESFTSVRRQKSISNDDSLHGDQFNRSRSMAELDLIESGRLSCFSQVVEKVVFLNRVEKAVLKAKSKFLKGIKDRSIREDHSKYGFAEATRIGLSKLLRDREAMPSTPSEAGKKDFVEEHKIEFPAEQRFKSFGKFSAKEYAGRAFRFLRKQWNVSEADIIESLDHGCLKSAPVGKDSFVTHDKRFQIQILSGKDAKFIRREMIPSYFEYASKNPKSSLANIYGVFRIRSEKDMRMAESNYIWVTQNAMSTNLQLHWKFNIKGASRFVSEVEREKLIPILKDQEMTAEKVELHFGGEKEVFVKQLRSDLEFLYRSNLVDYSVMIGIHDRRVDEQRKKLDLRWELHHEKFPLLPLEYVRVTSNRFWNNITDEGDWVENSTTDFEASMLKDIEQLDSNKPKDVGDGIFSWNSSQVFFIGIQNYLTRYSKGKELEHALKARLRGNSTHTDTTEMQPPEDYAKRLLSFIEGRIGGIPSVEQKRQDLRIVRNKVSTHKRSTSSTRALNSRSLSSSANTRPSVPFDLTCFEDVAAYICFQKRVQNRVLVAKKKFLDKRRSVIKENHRMFPKAAVIVESLRALFSHKPNTALEFPKSASATIEADDFGKEIALPFPPAGSRITSPHEFGAFSLVEYAPKVFQVMRLVHGIANVDLIESFEGYMRDRLKGKTSKDVELVSNDKRFLIQSIRHTQLKYLTKKFLPPYYNHVSGGSYSLIAKLMGVFKIQGHPLFEKQGLVFAIFENVFSSPLELHYKFDITGTMQNESPAAASTEHLLRPTLLDKEFAEMNQQMWVGKKKALLDSALMLDVELLTKVNTAGYTLQIGIHKMRKVSARRKQDNLWKTSYKSAPLLPFDRILQHSDVRWESLEGNGVDEAPSPSTTEELSPVPSKQNIFNQIGAGILAADQDTVFYLGITDYLKPYTTRKAMQHQYKGIKLGRKESNKLAMVPSKVYGSRLLSFILPRIHDFPRQSFVGLDKKISAIKKVHNEIRVSQRREISSRKSSSKSPPRKRATTVHRVVKHSVERETNWKIASVFEAAEHLVFLKRVEKQVMRAKELFLRKKKRIVVPGHPKYMLTKSIEMGISVIEMNRAALKKRTLGTYSSSSEKLKDGTLGFDDFWCDKFDTESKIEFPAEGSSNTPKHKLNSFALTEYCSTAFHKLRSLFNLKTTDMLSSMEEYMIDFVANSKSGELFFYTHDYRFMIKTVKNSEMKFLRKEFVHSYYEHIMKYPQSLLVKLYGLYRIQDQSEFKGGYNFIVMSNVFESKLQIHAKYDLKGSMVGRSIGSKADGMLIPVMKDQEFQDSNVQMYLGARRDDIAAQLLADADFLKRLNIMDYSLLVGIHVKGRQKHREENDLLWKNHYAIAPLLPFERVKVASDLHWRAMEDKKSLEEVVASIAQLNLGEEDDDIDPADLNGGIATSDGNHVLYFGIIDYLQTYGAKKKIEHKYKGIRGRAGTADLISAVPADTYANRFFKFIEERLKTFPGGDFARMRTVEEEHDGKSE